MEYFNLKLSTLRNPAYIGSGPIERATWLQVLAYCVDQENSGRIVGGAAWKDRQWQQTCGVTRREVLSSKKLLTVSGEDVCVLFYPLDKQAEVHANRAAGRKGGRSKSEEKRRAARENGARGGSPRKVSGLQNRCATQAPAEAGEPKRTQAETQRKEKGMEKEWNGNVTLAGAEAPGGGDGVRDRLAAIFKRKPGSHWSYEENRLYGGISFDGEEVDLIGRYYGAPIDADDDIRRKSLVKLLQEWHGEVDRARGWAARNPRRAGLHCAQRMNGHEPPGFRNWFRAAYARSSDDVLSRPWLEIPEDIRRGFATHERSNGANA